MNNVVVRWLWMTRKHSRKEDDTLQHEYNADITIIAIMRWRAGETLCGFATNISRKLHI